MYSATIVGTVTSIREKRVVGRDNQSVLDLSVAVNHNRRDANGDWKQESTTFQNVTLWGKLADNAEASLQVGDSVIVTGDIQTGKKYTDKNNEERTPNSSLNARTIGPDLRFTTVDVDRSGRKSKPRNENKRAQKPAQNNVIDDNIFEDESPF